MQDVYSFAFLDKGHLGSSSASTNPYARGAESLSNQDRKISPEIWTRVRSANRTAYLRKAAMGSAKRVDSNRTKLGRHSTRRDAHARPRTRANNAPPVKPDIDEIL